MVRICQSETERGVASYGSDLSIRARGSPSALGGLANPADDSDLSIRAERQGALQADWQIRQMVRILSLRAERRATNFAPGGLTNPPDGSNFVTPSEALPLMVRICQSEPSKDPQILEPLHNLNK